MADTPPTRIVAVNGRDIEVRMPTPTQAGIIGSASYRVKSMNGDITPDTLPRVLVAVQRCLDVLQSLAVSDTDQMWLEEEMLAGRLSLSDIVPFLTAWEEDEDSSPTRAANVRRTRR